MVYFDERDCYILRSLFGMMGLSMYRMGGVYGS